MFDRSICFRASTPRRIPFSFISISSLLDILHILHSSDHFHASRCCHRSIVNLQLETPTSNCVASFTLFFSSCSSNLHPVSLIFRRATVACSLFTHFSHFLVVYFFIYFSIRNQTIITVGLEPRVTRTNTRTRTSKMITGKRIEFEFDLYLKQNICRRLSLETNRESICQKFRNQFIRS